MKKFLLVLTILALAGGGAFAADVSGEVYGFAYILQGDSSGDSDVTATGGMSRLRLNVSGQNADGTLGGAMRFDANGLGFGKSGIMGSDNVNPANLAIKGYAWWKPNSIFLVGLGYKPGDWFGSREGVFTAMWGGANDVLVADNGNNNGDLRLGDGKIGTQYVVTNGWNRWGVGVELTPPVKGLKINIGVPYMADSKNTADGNPIGQIAPSDQNYTNMGVANAVRAKDMYSNIFYQAVYDTDIINGWVALTYRPDKWVPSANPVDNGQVYATVDSKAIDNLELTASFGYRLPGRVDSAYTYTDTYTDTSSKDHDFVNAYDFKTETTNHPVAVGLAGVYKNGALGVNFRTVARFGGNDWGNDRTQYSILDSAGTDIDSTEYVFDRPMGTESPFRIMADLVPNYDVTDNIRAYLALGITSIGETKMEGSAKNIPGAFGWSVNPYVSLAVGGRVSFYGGLRVQSNGGYNSDGSDRFKENDMSKGRDPIIQWAIPIGLSASF